MKIGIDFDNTLVSYDSVFYEAAKERNLLPDSVKNNKLAVRDYLRSIGKESEWIELQGIVYGARMSLACSYIGSIQFMQKALEKGNEIYIVSHKTKYPFSGQLYDLHKSALIWIEEKLHSKKINLTEKKEVFFEQTKEEKIRKINELNCDVFIDDLPEILNMDGFPTKTKKILFDPESKYELEQQSSYEIASNWGEIDKIIL